MFFGYDNLYNNLMDISMPRYKNTRNAPELMDPRVQSRNEKCKCGSGKKYKKCCGVPKTLDLITGKGCKVFVSLYNGSSKEEYTSRLNLANSCKDNDFPLCLPNCDYEVKILEIYTDVYPHDEFPYYTIQVKGEII